MSSTSKNSEIKRDGNIWILILWGSRICWKSLERVVNLLPRWPSGCFGELQRPPDARRSGGRHIDAPYFGVLHQGPVSLRGPSAWWRLELPAPSPPPQALSQQKERLLNTCWENSSVLLRVSRSGLDPTWISLPLLCVRSSGVTGNSPSI